MKSPIIIPYFRYLIALPPRPNFGRSEHLLYPARLLDLMLVKEQDICQSQPPYE